MTSLSWGNKRVCQECQARFYDLRKSPIVCPKCDTELALPAAFRAKVTKSKAASAVVNSEETELVEVELVKDDSADDLIEDTSDLGDEADDVLPLNPEELDSDSDDK